MIHRCSTDESVFLSENLNAGLVYFSHQLLDGGSMGRLRLLTASEQVFNDKLQEWEDFYNYHRPHGSLDGQTPYERLKQRTQARV